MARRYTGGFLSAKEQATDSNTANGVFTLAEAQEKTALGNFPTGRWTPSNSLRVRATANGYLSRTVTYPGDQRTWTWSGWVKYSGYDNGVYNATLFGGSNASFGNSLIMFSQTQNAPVYQLQFYNADATVRTKQVFRDPSAWYHIVCISDTTQATASERSRIFVNGVRVTTFESASYPAQNAQGNINAYGEHDIGKQPNQARYLDGYLSEVNFIDGQALDPLYFGQTDPETGTWVPKRYTGTYGTNGFYLPFNVDTTTYSADLLVVGGGGGGSNSGVAGGGGGAGGYVTRTLTIVPNTTYTVTVGAGGPVTTSGNNSLLGSYIAAGGGNGGIYDTINGAGNGGSGGGGGGSSGTPPGDRSGGGTLYSQGNAGGNSSGAISSGAGGGGAGGAGSSAINTGSGAAGGSGSTWSVNSVTYAGGGGGGNRAFDSGTGGAGGSGGGGKGGGTNGIAVAGTANLGGGGGGSGFFTGDYSGRAGGSGVVIIRIPDTKSLTFSGGVTYSGGTASGGYKTYTITATSTTSETVTFS